MKKLILLSLLLSLSTVNAINMQAIQNTIGYSNSYLQYNQAIQYQQVPQQSLQTIHKAFNLLHRSALKGHTLSQYELALMFHYGKGVRQNAELARLWFTRAAKKGHPQAQDILYRFYSAKKPSYYSNGRLRYSSNFRTFR